MTNIQFSKSITINAPTDAIWDAVINPEKIKLYLYGTNTKSTFKVGEPIVFSGNYEGTEYTDKGEILIFEPNKMFSYTYLAQFSGLKDLPENYQIVTFEIEDNGGANTLTVSQRNIHSEEAKKHAEGGWDAILQEIKKIVEKN